MLIAFCVIDRLPEDSDHDDAVAVVSKTRILEKRAMWSTPALVRESDAKIIPASSEWLRNRSCGCAFAWDVDWRQLGDHVV